MPALARIQASVAALCLVGLAVGSSRMASLWSDDAPGVVVAGADAGRGEAAGTLVLARGPPIRTPDPYPTYSEV